MKKVIIGALVLSAGLAVPIGTVAGAAQPKHHHPKTHHPKPKHKPTPTTTTTQPPQLTTQQQIAVWFQVTGKPSITAILTDLQTVQTAASSTDLPGMASGCQSLANDLAVAQNIAPIPDPDDQRLWASALSEYESGATACISAANNVDLSEAQQSNSDFQIGNALMSRLSATLVPS